MSIDCHLKLDGVKGEATHAKHKDEIIILSWDWNEHNASCTVGGGSAVGKATPGYISFAKRFDNASPTLARHCASGKHFKEATLSMSKAGGSQEDFMTVKLKEIYISAYNVNGSTGGDLMDNFSFSYGDIEVSYKPQKPDGTLGGEVKFGWDVRTTETR